MIALGLENVDWSKVLPAGRAKTIRSTLIEEQRIVREEVSSERSPLVSPTLDLRHAYMVLWRTGIGNEQCAAQARARTCKDLCASLGEDACLEDEQVRYALRYFRALLAGVRLTLRKKGGKAKHWLPRVRKEQETLQAWVDSRLTT